MANYYFFSVYVLPTLFPRMIESAIFSHGQLVREAGGGCKMVQNKEDGRREANILGKEGLYISDKGGGRHDPCVSP